VTDICYKNILGVLMFAVVCTSTTVQALDNDKGAVEKLINTLQKKGVIDDKTHGELIKDLEAPSDSNHTEAPRIQTNGRFQVSSADGKSSFRFGGRIHLDGSLYNDAGDAGFTNSFDARRARFEVRGTQDDNFDWKLDYEFAQHEDIKEGFRDAFIRYHVPDTSHSFTVGQFKEFFGLESLNSSNDLAFVERALPSRTFHDFAESSDGRRLGVGWNTNDGDLYTFSLGAFARNMSGDSYDGEGDPFAAEGRLTLSPIHTAKRALHAGLSANWLDINNPSYAKLKARPEAKMGSQALVSTGQMLDTESMGRYGAELGFVEGPLWSQAEYMYTTVNRTNAQSLQFSGWYANLGYVLTGESRGYSFKDGTFSNPKVTQGFSEGGWGALEVASRLSSLDLTDGDIEGGKETNFSAGINWFPNNNYKVMLTWTKVLDVTGGAYDGVTPSEILIRTQFAF
jgi:phosphate-selective porin OprO/OprP